MNNKPVGNSCSDNEGDSSYGGADGIGSDEGVGGDSSGGADGITIKKRIKLFSINCK